MGQSASDPSAPLATEPPNCISCEVDRTKDFCWKIGEHPLLDHRATGMCCDCFDLLYDGLDSQVDTT